MFKYSFFFFFIFSLLFISCGEKNTPFNTPFNNAFIDSDADNITDSLDNCPLTFNPNQLDCDEDGIGNVCDFNDSICDTITVVDFDMDGIADSIDNCPLVFNPNQFDCDEDGIGNVCDLDAPEVVVCQGGFAGFYPCSNYNLMSHLPMETFEDTDSTTAGNDLWGWTDPMNGKEYALVGLSTGVGFVDISDPICPKYLGRLPTTTIETSWRDVKVYNNHAFIVADNAGSHGMQVFDLTTLRSVAKPPVLFSYDALYTGETSVHNVVINESKGFAYLVGGNTFSGGIHFVNIQNPKSPLAAGGYAGDGYIHDAQVVTYNGPDSKYIGKEILIGCGGDNVASTDEVMIVDVTDKNNPIKISEFKYPNPDYSHQGWLTENHKYFIFGDELDEGIGSNTRTLVLDLTDLDNPVLHTEHFGTTPSIDHNGYVRGNTFYLANYTAGVRMLDISNIDSKVLTEVGFFDTFPTNNSAQTKGAWSVYPYFLSGNIIINTIDRGLFIIRKNGT